MQVATTTVVVSVSGCGAANSNARRIIGDRIWSEIPGELLKSLIPISLLLPSFSPKFINPTDSIPIPIRTIEQSARLDVYQMLKPTQIILASSPALSASKKKTRFVCLPSSLSSNSFKQNRWIGIIESNRIELKC